MSNQNQGYRGQNQSKKFNKWKLVVYGSNNQGFQPNFPQQQPYVPIGQFGNQKMPLPNVNESNNIV